MFFYCLYVYVMFGVEMFVGSENMIQLDMATTVTVLLGDIVATVLIGWAVYSICAQPKAKSNHQRANKGGIHPLQQTTEPSGQLHKYDE